MFIFSGLQECRELYLQHNRLSSLATDTFAPLRALRRLRLDGNRLAAWPAWQLTASNPGLVSLRLAANPWTCDCDFINPFLVYLWKSGSKIEVVYLSIYLSIYPSLYLYPYFYLSLYLSIYLSITEQLSLG